MPSDWLLQTVGGSDRVGVNSRQSTAPPWGRIRGKNIMPNKWNLKQRLVSIVLFMRYLVSLPDYQAD